MAGGFGNGGFGQKSPFGEWSWSRYVLFSLIPEAYRNLDETLDTPLENFISTLQESFDGLRRKIRDLGDLRDPYKVQTDRSGLVNLTLGKLVSKAARIEQAGYDGTVVTVGTTRAFTAPSARFTAESVGKEIVIARSKVRGNNITVRILFVVDQFTAIPDPLLHIDVGLLRWELRSPPEANPDSIIVEVESGNVETVGPGWVVSDGKGDFQVLARDRFSKDTDGIELITRYGEDGTIDSSGRLSTNTANLTPRDIGKYILILGSAYPTNNGRHAILDVAPQSYPATGTLTFCSGSEFVTGETLTLDDGSNPVTVFEFRKSGMPTPGNIAVNITDDMDASEVRDALLAVFPGAGLDMTAAADGSSVLALTATVLGTLANQTIEDTVTTTLFVTNGMTGGLEEHRAVFSLLEIPGIRTSITVPGTGQLSYTTRLRAVSDNPIRVRHVSSATPGVSIKTEGNSVTVTFQKDVSTANDVIVAFNTAVNAFALTRVAPLEVVPGVISPQDWVTIEVPASQGTVRYSAVYDQFDLTPPTVEHVVSGYSTALSVSVTDYAVTVNLATDQYGTPTSTATQVVAAVTGSTAASELVHAAASGTGSGIAGPYGPTAVEGFELTTEPNPFKWAVQPVARLTFKGPVPMKGICEQQGVKGALTTGMYPIFDTDEASFTASDVGKLLSIQGSSLGNDGIYEILTVLTPNSVELRASLVTEQPSVPGDNELRYLVWYLRSPTLIGNYAQVALHKPSFLKYLASEFGVEVQKEEDDAAQRRWVAGTSRWMDRKGAAIGYTNLATTSSFTATPTQLYNVSIEEAQLLDATSVYEIGTNLDLRGADGVLTRLTSGVYQFSSPSAVFTRSQIDKYLRIKSPITATVGDPALVADGNTFAIYNCMARSSGERTDVAFVNSDPDTITRVAGSFVLDGWLPGDTITVSGSASNDGNFTIATVTALTLTLIATDSLVTEGAGAAVTITSTNNATRYEYDSDASVEEGHVSVAFVTGGTSMDIRDSIVTAVNTQTSRTGIVALPVALDTFGLRTTTVPGVSIGQSPSATPRLQLSLSEPGRIYKITDWIDSNTVEVLPALRAVDITTTPGSDIVDGDSFIISDGVNPVVTFEFDSDATYTAGNVLVTYTGADTAETIRDSIRTAIESVVETGYLGVALDNRYGTSTLRITLIGSPRFDLEIATEGGSGIAGDFEITEVEEIDYNEIVTLLPPSGANISTPTTGASTDIAFVDNNPNPDTITRVAGSFITDGFTPGATITVTGSAANDNTFILQTVEATTLTLTSAGSLTTEAAGASVTIRATGDLITIDDGDNVPTVFEFMTAAGAVDAGHVAIIIAHAPESTVLQVRDLIIAAINGVGVGTLDVKATLLSESSLYVKRYRQGKITITTTADMEIVEAADTLNNLGWSLVALYTDVAPERPVMDEFNYDVAATAASELVLITNGDSSTIREEETFTIDDGVNIPTTFEFDYDGSTTFGNIPVSLTLGWTAAQIRDAAVTAVNSAPLLYCTASVNTNGLLEILRDSVTPITTGSRTDVAFVDNFPTLDTITRTTGSFVDDGFVVDTKVTVTGSTSNDGVYTIDTVAALTLTLVAADELTNEIAGTATTITTAPTATPTVTHTVTDKSFRVEAGFFGPDQLCSQDTFADYVRLGAVSAATNIGYNRYSYDITGMTLSDKSSTPQAVIENKRWEIEYLEVDGDVLLTHYLETPPKSKQGLIQAVAGDVLTNGDTFTLDDGTNTPVVFEFNTGSASSLDRVLVPYTAADTAATVTTAIRDAVNSVGSELNCTATQDLTTKQVALTLDDPYTDSSNFIACSASAPALAAGFSSWVNVFTIEVLTDTPVTVGATSYRLHYSCAKIFTEGYAGCSRIKLDIEDSSWVNGYKHRLDRLADVTPAHVTYFPIRQQTISATMQATGTGTTS